MGFVWHWKSGDREAPSVLIKKAGRADKEQLKVGRARSDKGLQKITKSPTLVVQRRPASRAPAAVRPLSGKLFNNGSSSYRYLPSIRAIRQEELGSISDFKLIEKKFGRALIRSQASFDSAGWVVQNQKSHLLGVVTGIIKVKLKDFDKRNQISEEFALVEYYSFPGIRLTLLQADAHDLEGLQGIQRALSGDPRVESASLEILEAPVSVQ